MFSFVNWKVLLEKAVVTFLEAGLAFLAVNRWDVTNKAVVAGAIGAGISAVYNLTKQYNQK